MPELQEARPGDPSEGDGEGDVTVLLRTLPGGLRRGEHLAGAEGRAITDPIIQVIEAQRVRAHLSYQDVADRVGGVTRQTVHGALSGKTKSPGLRVVRRLAHAVGLDLAVVPLDTTHER